MRTVNHFTEPQRKIIRRTAKTFCMTLQMIAELYDVSIHTASNIMNYAYDYPQIDQ